MIAVLRTIAIINAVTVAAVALLGAVGALFGLAPMQTLGAGCVGLLTLGIVVGWRAVLRYASRPPRQEWTYTRRHSPLAGEPRVSHPMIVAGDAPPEMVIYVLPPAQIEAPKREVEAYHDV